MMKPEHEHMLEVEALTRALQRAALEGISLKLQEEMRELVLRDMEAVFRRRLTDEPLVLVTPMRLRWNLAACPAKAKPWAFPPEKLHRLAQEMAMLEQAALAYHNPQAVFSRVALATKRGDILACCRLQSSQPIGGVGAMAIAQSGTSFSVICGDQLLCHLRPVPVFLANADR